MITPKELIEKAIETIESLNITEIFGRGLNERGDNNYSVITTAIVLNMTHYMWNDTKFLPGVPTPLELNM